MVGVLQVGSEGPLADTLLYGHPLARLAPTVLDPREPLGGALINGAYDWPGVRNVTATYQTLALVRELFAADGERVRFAGLILALGYLDTAFEKERSAMPSARLAASLGADAAICTTFSSGNSHTDTMLTVRASSARGSRRSASSCETNGGLTDHVPEADVHRELGERGRARAGVDARARGRVPTIRSARASPCRRGRT